MMYRQLTPDLSKGVGYTLDELQEISANTPQFKADPVEIKETPQVDIVTKEQADELTILFSECDPSYVTKVWQTLRKAPISIDEIDQLPASLFDRIRAALMKNRDEFVSKQQEIEECFDNENSSEALEA